MTLVETPHKDNDKCSVQRNPETPTSPQPVTPNVHVCYAKVIDCIRAHPIFKRLSAESFAQAEGATSDVRGSDAQFPTAAEPAENQSPDASHSGSSKRERRYADTRRGKGATSTHGIFSDGDVISRLVRDIHEHPMFKLAAEATHSNRSIDTRPPGVSSVQKVEATKVAKVTLPRQTIAMTTGGKMKTHGDFSMLMSDLRAHPKFRCKRASLLRATDSSDDCATVVSTGGATVVPKGGTTGVAKWNTARVIDFSSDTRLSCGCRDCVATQSRTNAKCLSPARPRESQREERSDTTGRDRRGASETSKTTATRPMPVKCEFNAYDLAAKIMLNEVDAGTLNALGNQTQKITVKRSNQPKQGDLSVRRTVRSSRIPVRQKQRMAAAPTGTGSDVTFGRTS